MLTVGLKAAYWKPVQSGCTPTTDKQWLKTVTNLPDSHFLPERYLLSQPLSPHQAAAIDGVQIALSDFTLPEKNGFQHLLVEGAGGLMVPLNNHELMIDLIARLKLPVALVTRSTLGTINHTLLSLNLLRSRSIPVWGVIMNGPRNQANRQAIEHWGQAKVVAEIEPLETIDSHHLALAFQKYFPISS